MAKALSDNPRVLAQLQAYQVAKSDKDFARGGFMPRLVLNADIGKEKRNNVADVDTDLTRQEISLILTQPLFHGGSNYSDFKSSELALDSAHFSTLSQANNTALNVTTTYLDVLLAQELLMLSEQNLAIHEETAEKVFQRQKNGVGDKADTSQIRGRIARAKANLNTARSKLSDARTNYLTIVGDFPDHLQKPKVNKTYLPENRQDTVIRSINNNPSMLKSLFDVKSSNYRIKSAKGDYYPQIDLVLKKTEETDVDGLRGDQDDQQVLIQMQWNIFNGLRDSASVQKAKAKSSQLQMQSNSVRRQVLQEVDLAWSAFRTNRENRLTLQDYVQAAKDTEILYTDQFSVNRRTLLDLLDSKNELFEARKAWLNADVELQKSSYRLIYVTGDLLASLSIQFSQVLDAVSESAYEGVIND